MIAVAGDVITRYHNEFDSPSGAFRTACIHFYQSIDSSGQLEMLLKARTADTFKQKVLMRRALSSIYLQRGMNKSGSISYDALTEESLKKIYNLMAENLDLQTASNQQDRVRWLETYRRLPEFSLNDAYQFLMAWPDANDNIFVCYYRFIVSFALYCRTGAVNYEEVRKHLRQCEQLSRNAYGKNITASLNYFGYCEEVPEYEILVPRPMFDPLENKETRTERHIAFRKQHCQWFRGNIASIHDGLITIRFQVGDNSFEQFEAKAPNDIKIPIEKDGMPISFRLGFSYSGFRAWDLELDV